MDALERHLEFGNAREGRRCSLGLENFGEEARILELEEIDAVLQQRILSQPQMRERMEVLLEQLVSLRFYLLRKNRYDVSSDVFNKFQDKQGDFFQSDTNSLLSSYSAAHMRTKGEKVLDKAIYFTKKHLLGALEHLESPCVEEVYFALLTPPFRRVRILEARSYIPCYEKEPTRNEAILELAKLNFNILQLLFCEELKEVTLWWQKLKVGSNLSFVRDRIVETYFWINGTSYNHKYSYSRIIATKITAFMTIIDDILDTYGSTEESMQLAEAINRWDEGAVDVLPEYMKDIYLYLLETFRSFEEHLGPGKSYRVVYLKESAISVNVLIFFMKTIFPWATAKKHSMINNYRHNTAYNNS
ncbi:(S)-beta-macrocarpene synthase-like [Triticum dicoccoides]|uniref:(S)-beta-macrocarpene synthase-like n=1 Tax=Triticum dicoccoides TaxID=85692 RepID=UPI00189038F8|nr:(S)-beta-macrocarpene synthase-like [Triticum dicoccoides]